MPSFTGFLLTVLLCVAGLAVLVVALKPVAALLGVLFKSTGGWALLALIVLVVLLASGGFLNGVL